MGSSSDPSQQCRALWPLTGRAGASLYVACGVRLLSSGERWSCQACRLQLHSSSHPRERAQLAGPAGDGRRPRGYFPRATVLTATHRLEMAFPSLVQISICLRALSAQFLLILLGLSSLFLPGSGHQPRRPLSAHSASFPGEQSGQLLLSPHSADPIAQGAGSRPRPSVERQRPVAIRGQPRTRRLLLHVGLGQQRDPDQTLSLLTRGWKGSSACPLRPSCFFTR